MKDQIKPLTLQEAAFIDAVSSAIGADRIMADASARECGGHDVFFQDVAPSCIATPRTKEEVGVVVREAAGHGFAVTTRGGGMSYTGGYLTGKARTVTIDMSMLDQVIAIDEENLLVTVQCGCTWKDLYQALLAKGLRVPAFGTMSGDSATVGGGLSQGSIFFGSTRYGTSADMVTGLEVVLADGEIVRTGQAATGNAQPFFRYYGPDLSGIFLGDCGALGIKVEATLRLIPVPSHVAGASFAFEDFESAWKAQLAIAKAGLAAEIFSFDAVLQHQLMNRTSLINDMATLTRVARGGRNLIRGMRDAVRVAITGKRFLDDAPYSVHLVAEERTEVALDAAMAGARDLARSLGGQEVADAIPTVMRAQPFGNMDMTLGPAGERWVPVHGLVSLSNGLDAMIRVQEYLQAQGERLVEHKIIYGILSMVVAPSVFVIEVLFYWPDAPSPLHKRIVSPDKLAQALHFSGNASARQVVAELREGIAEVFATLGGGHFGAGRSLPYRKYRHARSYDLLQRLKCVVDPNGTLNPGVLGLD